MLKRIDYMNIIGCVYLYSFMAWRIVQLCEWLSRP